MRTPRYYAIARAVAKKAADATLDAETRRIMCLAYDLADKRLQELTGSLIERIGDRL